jgi:phosphoribosylaminoimidazole carboxylase PurE protein
MEKHICEVVVVVGSESDLEHFQASRAAHVLDTVLGPKFWTLAVYSADRNPDELKAFCLQKKQFGTHVFLAIAGKINVLAAAITREVFPQCFVVGVGLDSGSSLTALASLLSLTEGPKGKAIPTTGIGKDAIYNAAIVACWVIGLLHLPMAQRLGQFMQDNNKPAIPEVESGRIR